MKPGTRKYSDEQNAAVVRAQLAEGLSAREVSRRAAAGELAGLEAFAIPWKTCTDKALKARREERLTQAAQGSPAEVLRTAAGEVVSLLGAELERARRARRAGRMTPERVASLAVAVMKAAQMLRALDAGKAPRAAPRENGATPDADDFLGGLARSMPG